MATQRRTRAPRCAIACAAIILSSSCTTDSTTESTEALDTTPPATSEPEPDTSTPPASEADPEPSAAATPASSERHIEGHRGARGLKPENTLPAFETALDLGVTTLEFDLQLSADDEVIVWHDSTLSVEKCRLADDADPSLVAPTADAGIAIRSLTAAELSQYRCDLNPDPATFPDQENSPTVLAGDRYQPATLVEVFEFVTAYASSADKTEQQRERAAVVEFNIETKRDLTNPDAIGDDFDGTNPGRFELETLAAVEASGFAERVVIQSFDHRSLWAIRSVDSNIRLSALTLFDAPDLTEYAQQGANIWSSNFNVVTQELVDEAHSLGLEVIPWTVNDPDDMVRLFDLGVDGIITDRPDLAAELQ